MEFLRSVGAQYATKNEDTEPKQKQHQVVYVIGDGSKVQCCKE